MSSEMPRGGSTDSEDEHRSSAPSTVRQRSYRNNTEDHQQPGFSRENNIPTASSPPLHHMPAHPLWIFPRDSPRQNIVPMLPFQYDPPSSPRQYHPIITSPSQNLPSISRNHPTSSPSQSHPIMSSPSQDEPISPFSRYYLNSLRKPPAGADFFQNLCQQDSPPDIQDHSQNTHPPCFQSSQSQPPPIPHQTPEQFQFFTSYQGAIPQSAHDTSVPENGRATETNDTHSNDDISDHISNWPLRHVPLNVTSYVDQYNRVWTCESLLKKECSEKKGKNVDKRCVAPGENVEQQITCEPVEEIEENEKETDSAQKDNVASTSNFFDCLSSEESSDSIPANSQANIRIPLERKPHTSTYAEPETSDDSSNELDPELPSLPPVLAGNEEMQRRRRSNVPKTRTDRGLKLGRTQVASLGGSEEDNTAVVEETVKYGRSRASTAHRTPANNQRLAALASLRSASNARNQILARNARARNALAAQNQNNLNAPLIAIFPATENVDPNLNIWPANSLEEESPEAGPEDGDSLNSPATSTSDSDIPGMWSVIKERRLEERTDVISENVNHSQSQRTVRLIDNTCLPDGRTGMSITVAVNHVSAMQNHSTCSSQTSLFRSINERINALGGLLDDIGDGALPSSSSADDSEMMNNYRSINFWDVQRNDTLVEQGRRLRDTAYSRRSGFRNLHPASNSMDRNMVPSRMNMASNILEKPPVNDAGPSTATGARHGNVVLPNTGAINKRNGNTAISSSESTNRATMSGGNGNTALPPRNGILKNATTVRHGNIAFPNNVITSRRIGNVAVPHYEVQNSSILNVGSGNVARTVVPAINNMATTSTASNTAALNHSPSGFIEEAPRPNDPPSSTAEDREISDEEHAAIYNSMVAGTYQPSTPEPAEPLQLPRYNNLYSEEDENFVEYDPNGLALNDPEEAAGSMANGLLGNGSSGQVYALPPNLPIILGLSQPRHLSNTAAAEARSHWQQLEAITYRRRRSYNTVQSPSLERRNPRVAEELLRLQDSEDGLVTASTVAVEASLEVNDEAGPSFFKRNVERVKFNKAGYIVKRNAGQHGLRRDKNGVDGNVVDLVQANVGQGSHRDGFREESREDSSNAVEVQISTSYQGEVREDGNGVEVLEDDGNVVDSLTTGKRVHFQEKENESEGSGDEQ